VPDDETSRRKVLSPNDRLDLRLAAELQTALLPRRCPGVCPHQDAAARNRMRGDVGGDFYDLIRVHDDQVAVVIGDVVGHGVHAALLMAKIMSELRSAATKRSYPTRVVDALNRMLVDLGDRTGTTVPCTLVYGVIDGPTGTGYFVNAGHPRPFLCDRTKCRVLQVGPRNLLLGVEPYEYEEACYQFEPGERLVLYTDGVTDAVNAAGEHFGEARLHEVIDAQVDRSADQCAEAVFDAVDAWRDGAGQADDETVVVIDRI